MKKMKRFTTLLLSLTMIVMMSAAVYADNGGTFTFNGTDIVGDEIAEGSINFSDMEPGDSLELEFTYVNDSDVETDWYLSNDVIKTLEEGSEATDGGYTYELVNNGVTKGEVTIFSSDAVAGDESLDADSKDVGLHDATNALSDNGSGEDNWIYIDTLQPGEQGNTYLKVALDGESQANVYMETEGQLKIAYAVETKAPEERITHVAGNVKTGDDTNFLVPIVMFVASLLLLILAVLSFRKDRREREAGEDA